VKNPVTFKLRNDAWPKTMKRFKILNPLCAVCGARKKLVVHHIRPYYLFPSQELNEENLITLCERCHLFVGHLTDYKKYNADIIEHAKWWKDTIDSADDWRVMR